MKYHVVYQPGDVTYYTTNFTEVTTPIHLLDSEFMLNQPGTQVVTWQLNDLPLTKKFATSHINTLKHFIDNQNNSFNYAYDVYSNPLEEPILQSRQVMNNIIDEFNNVEWGWFKISDDLRLDPDNINNAKIKALNTLHDLFEDNLPILIEKNKAQDLPEDVDFDTWYNNFQTINMMVHYNEVLTQYVGVDNDHCRQLLAEAFPKYFTSLKVNYQPGLDNDTIYDIKMEPEDYADFTYIKPKGWLELDFGTVGKDLWSCAWTDDIELVQKGKLSQQTYRHPWVAFGWLHHIGDIHHQNNLTDKYNKWIEDNNVGDYIDLNDPQYTPGRHILGECISHDIDTPNDFIEQIINGTPKILGTILTDDNDKTLL